MTCFPEGTPHPMRVRILATISLGLLSAACQGTYSQNAPGAAAPADGNSYQSSSAACPDYGFRAGTTNFNQCVASEQQARAAGRVNRNYVPASDRGCAWRVQLTALLRDGVLRSLRQPRGRRPHLSRRRIPAGSSELYRSERQPHRCPGLSC